MQQKLQNTKNLVSDVFDKVHNEYDLMNNLMSFGIHKSWKKKLFYKMKPKENKKLIDVACGTGDIAKIFLDLTNDKSKVHCVDSNAKMISIGEKKLKKYRNKIITDLDLIFLLKKSFKSIVVTGTNGKSTTCKILSHVLKKNGFNVLLGGNIGTPVLDLKIKKNCYVVIEASSFQLAYSKFVQPDYALLLNISNDHLDWHGNMGNYINSKLKIFSKQKKNQYSLINRKLKLLFKKNKFQGKLTIPHLENYQKKKDKIRNFYLKLKINDENVSNVFAVAKLLKIKEKSLLKSLNTFKGLPHRYEIFYKRKNCTFINDSKATSFQATKFALENSKNIFWIVGGLPKKKDKLVLNNLKQNVIKSYIIGKNINFFRKQIQSKIDYSTSRNLKSAILKIFKDIKIFKKKENTILLSPASASYDQFLNFEKRGNQFKKLIKNYADRHI